MKKLFSLIAVFGASAVAFADEELMDAPVKAAQGSPWTMPMMLGVGFVAIYFLIMRPERKRRREMQNRRDGLKKGDKVTAMGIRGTVVSLKEQTAILSLYDGAKMEVIKAAITEVDPTLSAREVEQPAT
jgi:preprotein translocase subunit YajC